MLEARDILAVDLTRQAVHHLRDYTAQEAVVVLGLEALCSHQGSHSHFIKAILEFSWLVGRVDIDKYQTCLGCSKL